MKRAFILVGILCSLVLSGCAEEKTQSCLKWVAETDTTKTYLCRMVDTEKYDTSAMTEDEYHQAMADLSSDLETVLDRM